MSSPPALRPVAPDTAPDTAPVTAPGTAAGTPRRPAPWAAAPARPRLAWSTPEQFLGRAMPMTPLMLLLGALLVVEHPIPGLPVAVPTSDTVMGVLVLLGITRPRRISPPAHRLIIGLLALGVIWLLAVSLAEDVEWVRRIVRLSLLVGFAGGLATGRIPVRPIVLGMAVGLVVNAVLFYNGIGPDEYQGVLSGYLLDKNVAGLAYALTTLLVLAFVPGRCLRALVFTAGAGLVFLTGSRTSMAALLLAGVWLLLSRRVGRLGRGGLLVVLYVVFVWAEENLATLEVFGDRTGTDWFRARIDAESWKATQAALPWGSGAGQAVVTLPPDDNPFFFHNSYWALLVEGGWPLALAVLGAFVLGGLGLGSTVPATRAIATSQAAVIVVFLCAFRLGEVFLTVIAMLTLGAAMALRELERRRLRQEAVHRGVVGHGR